MCEVCTVAIALGIHLPFLTLFSSSVISMVTLKGSKGGGSCTALLQPHVEMKGGVVALVPKKLKSSHALKDNRRVP